MDPFKVPRLEMDSLPVLVDLLHNLGVHLLYPLPDLSMEVFDFFHALLGLPTILGWNG